jgi:cytochrome c oxidase subunit 4
MSHQATATIIHSTDSHANAAGQPHVMPLTLLLTVFSTLIGLTIVTVTASKLSLGAAEIWVAMGIATVKAVLVAAYFMHLRYDKPFNAFLFLFSLVFAAIFIGLVLVDSQAYQPEIAAEEMQTQNQAANPNPAATPK